MFLVTGPSGNVGMEVARLAIEERPLPYRIAAHHPEKLKKKYGDDVSAQYFDYNDRESWSPILDGVDTVFLVFPTPHPSTINKWMTPFIDEMTRCSVKHIIYLDVTAAADSKAVPHYHVERHIEASGIGYTFLRSSYFMQNFCRGLSTHGVDIVDHHELFIPAGTGKMTLLDGRDVAEVVMKIAKEPEAHKNTAYTLNGPENLDMYETAKVFSEVFGQEIRYVRPSMPQFWWRLWRRGVKWDVIVFMTIVYTLTRQGQNAPQSDDLDKLLGRSPRTLRQFVQEEKWRWDTRTWT